MQINKILLLSESVNRKIQTGLVYQVAWFEYAGKNKDDVGLNKIKHFTTI